MSRCEGCVFCCDEETRPSTLVCTTLYLRGRRSGKYYRNRVYNDSGHDRWNLPDRMVREEELGIGVAEKYCHAKISEHRLGSLGSRNAISFSRSRGKHSVKLRVGGDPTENSRDRDSRIGSRGHDTRICVDTSEA